MQSGTTCFFGKSKYHNKHTETICLINPYLGMDSPIITNWMSPLSFLGVLGVILLITFSMKFHYGVTPGAMLFANVPKKDARHI